MLTRHDVLRWQDMITDVRMHAIYAKTHTDINSIRTSGAEDVARHTCRQWICNVWGSLTLISNTCTGSYGEQILQV